MSKYEDYISQLLTKSSIRFFREYTFPKCYNGLYRFDFYCPNLNACIEFNGAQHYTYTPHFHKSKSDFSKAQERDRRKISYCLAQGIKLYIIPYWEVENIYTARDLFQPQYLARSKFHNDEVYRSQKSKEK